jgi:hypothetical protein
MASASSSASSSSSKQSETKKKRKRKLDEIDAILATQEKKKNNQEFGLVDVEPNQKRPWDDILLIGDTLQEVTLQQLQAIDDGFSKRYSMVGSKDGTPLPILLDKILTPEQRQRYQRLSRFQVVSSVEALTLDSISSLLSLSINVEDTDMCEPSEEQKQLDEEEAAFAVLEPEALEPILWVVDELTHRFQYFLEDIKVIMLGELVEFALSNGDKPHLIWLEYINEVSQWTQDMADFMWHLCGDNQCKQQKRDGLVGV